MKVLSFKQLKAEKGIEYCRVHVLRLMKRGEFPQSWRIGPNCVVWDEAEIDAWLAEKKKSREVRRCATN